MVSGRAGSVSQPEGAEGHPVRFRTFLTAVRRSSSSSFLRQLYSGVLPQTSGTVSPNLNHEAQLILRWAEDQGISLIPQFILGRCNVLSDSLSRQGQVIGSEWTLRQEVVDQLTRR